MWMEYLSELKRKITLRVVLLGFCVFLFIVIVFIIFLHPRQVEVYENQECQRFQGTLDDNLFLGAFDFQNQIVSVNFGPNLTPILGGPKVQKVVLFEVMFGVCEELQKMDLERFVVFCFAIGIENRISSLREYNNDGQSSTLAGDLEYFVDKFPLQSIRNVIVVRGRDIIQELLNTNTLAFVKTDIQGFDVRVWKSFGEDVKGFLCGELECYCGGVNFYAEIDGENSCEEYSEILQGYGMTIIRECEPSQRGEIDIEFINENHPLYKSLEDAKEKYNCFENKRIPITKI